MSDLSQVTGIFETLRYKEGVIEYLDRHLERLRRSCLMLGWQYPSCDYGQIIRETLKREELIGDLSRIRIVVTHGDVHIDVRRYSPLPRECYTQGAKLQRAHHPEFSPCARLKLRDRPKYDEALGKAEEEGYHESLLCHEGMILEGTTTNLIISHQGKYFIPPREDFRLPGVMERVVIEALGTDVIETPLRWPLASDSRIYLTSSLKGIVPVESIDGDLYPVDREDQLFQLISRFWPVNRR